MKHTHRVMVASLLLLVAIVHTSRASCPIEDDPSTLLRCVQLDITTLMELARGSSDFSGLCSLASRYLECIRAYTRGCLGFYIGDGAMTELQNIATYCCNGVAVNDECPFNPLVAHKCIDGKGLAQLSDGSSKPIEELQVGDRVRTLDAHTRQLVDTDVIMIMDADSEHDSLFLDIRTHTNKSVRVSASHLVALSDGTFKFAKQLRRDQDTLLTYDARTQTTQAERIALVLVEPSHGYAAPLTQAGTLLVDGILVSSYAVVASHTLAHAAMAPVRWWYTMHTALNVSSESLGVAKQAQGVHWYPTLLYNLSGQLLQSLIDLH